MVNKTTKSQIPLEDRTLIDGLMLKVWKHDDAKALSEITRILADYSNRGFYTMDYGWELLKYYATKNQIVLYEDLI